MLGKMYVLINKKIGRNLERNNGNDMVNNKKKILVVGDVSNNNYIKKLLESNYEIIIADETDYSNLRGYKFDTMFIDECAEIKQLKQLYVIDNMDDIEEKELIKKENNRIQNNNMIAGMKGYKSKKYKRYF
jgi:hypothetical protein